MHGRTPDDRKHCFSGCGNIRYSTSIFCNECGIRWQKFKHSLNLVDTLPYSKECKTFEEYKKKLMLLKLDITLSKLHNDKI